jgi:hypothetical protein
MQIYNKTISLLNSDYCLTPDEQYISYIYLGENKLHSMG